MTTKPFERMTSRERGKLEKYIKDFIAKVPQAVVQSRCGEKRKFDSSWNSSDGEVFALAIDDIPDIQEKFKEACLGLNPLQPFNLCIEILLKTAEGDTLILEHWSLSLSPSETYWDPKMRVYSHPQTIIGNLMMLLKSILAISRVIPAYKLSLGQSATTYVILYRIYQGDPQMHLLGSKHRTSQLGEVHSPFGTIRMSVSYRSKQEMMIAPQNSSKDSSFMVKSDYFNLDLSPKRQCSSPRLIKNRIPRNANNGPNFGAFASCTAQGSEPSFPELDFLQKTILHPGRSCLQKGENGVTGEDVTDNGTSGGGDMNSNVTVTQERRCENEVEQRLSSSDVSDGSDFVLIDMKPPFADYDPETDLGVFYQECQCAPTLSSFSTQPSVKEQVMDITSQLEKFEISMLDFDNFVDSVCQIDAKN